MKLAEFIIEHIKKIEKVFIGAVLVSILFSAFVNVNYDLTEYLPSYVQSKAGLDLMEKEFGYPGTARIMLEDVTIYEAKEYKDRLEAVDGVDMILWCDSTTNIYSGSFINYDSITDYYKDGCAVMDVTFVEGDTSERTSKAIDEMKDITGEKGRFVGMAVQNKSLAENVKKEMQMIMVLAVIFIFLILCLSTTAWTEPILFLLVMGVAIIINKGTNVFLGTISFLTDSVSAVLQLAVSMDYSIFLLHAFTRERESGKEIKEALVNAVNEAINSILASSLTTIVGFIVLMVMQFRIGFDLGLVLAKGIVISLVTVLFLMPALILRFAEWNEKTRHKAFLPSFQRLSQLVYKSRKFVLIFVAVITIPAYVAQGMNDFLFGNDAVGAGEGTRVYEDEQKIIEKFGRSNMMMAIVPNTSNVTEREFTKEVEQLPYIKSIQSLSGTMPEGIPESFLPESITGLLHTEDYSRILIFAKTKGESALAYQASDEIQHIMKKYYPTASYLVGATPSTQDIQTTITKDYAWVNLLSLAGVFLVVMISFHSLVVPALVMVPIEAAIFVNMAVPYIRGETMIYIGYIIVSCIQLGATVDYSILTANNYIECRKSMDKKDAMVKALMLSTPAIFTSGTILTVVGYILYHVSSIAAIGDLGHLIGRGALLSSLFVLFVLPALLTMADSLVMESEWERFKRLFKRVKRKLEVKTHEE